MCKQHIIISQDYNGFQQSDRSAVERQAHCVSIINSMDVGVLPTSGARVSAKMELMTRISLQPRRLSAIVGAILLVPSYPFLSLQLFGKLTPGDEIYEFGHQVGCSD